MKTRFWVRWDRGESQEFCTNGTVAVLASEDTLLELHNSHIPRYLILAFGLKIDFLQRSQCLIGDGEISLQIWCIITVAWMDFSPAITPSPLHIFVDLRTESFHYIFSAFSLRFGKLPLPLFTPCMVIHTHRGSFLPISHYVPYSHNNKWSLLHFSLHESRYSWEWCYINA